MAPRRKRQRLSGNGDENAILLREEITVDHTKPEQTPAQDKSTQAKRSLFVRSLPSNTTTEDLTEHFSQSFPIKHAVAVVDRETKLCKGYGFVTFAEAEDAQQAVQDLNGSEIHGSKIRVEAAEPRHRGEAAEGETKSGTPKKIRPGQPVEDQQPPKLIIRNLPWSIGTEEKLTKLFLSYGKVTHAAIPKNPQGRMLGFGIVIIRGRKNAEKALAGVNGKRVDDRTLAVDWAVDKETWQKVTKAELLKDAEPVLPKGTNFEGDTESDIDGDLAPNEGHFSDDDADIEVEEEGGVGGGGVVAEDVEPIKPRITSNESTLFVRNLPFNCSDEDLQEHFEQFGAVRYARIVVDRETERPRGTGFVCFYRQAEADECLKSAPRAKVAPSAQGKRDPSATGHSVLQNEFSDLSGDFTMDGRVLQVTRAVEKQEATRLTAEGTAQRNTRDRDKRRLYLLSEGTIPSNTPLYQTLSPSEIAMREASSKQRKALIESNPSLHISLTRLSVRNIPRTLTTKDLKGLAREAVVGFAVDVKAGTRQRLSKEEVARAADEMKAAEKERKESGKGIVKQAKIVYEGQEGGKVSEGAGRSRGYGFVEYYTHRNALMGLRWLNGHSIDYKAAENKGKNATNEDIQERKKRLIVEFAIENAQVVTRRNEREVRSRERAKAVGLGHKEATEEGTGISYGTSKPKKRKLHNVAMTAEGEELAKRQKIISRKRLKKARKIAAK